MPREGTQDVQKHYHALRSAYESNEAREAGIPEGILRFDATNKNFRTTEFYDWQEDMRKSGTADVCRRCHRTRFGAPDFMFQEQKEDGPVTYNTQWCFIPRERKICVVCSAKAKAKAKNASKPKQSKRQTTPSPSPPLAISADHPMMEKMFEMLESMQHQVEQLLETNEQLVAENETLRDEVKKINADVEHILAEVMSLSNVNDKMMNALQEKAGVSFESTEDDIFDAELHDDTYHNPGKFIAEGNYSEDEE